MLSLLVTVYLTNHIEFCLDTFTSLRAETADDWPQKI